MFILQCKELKHSGVLNVKVIFDEKYYQEVVIKKKLR